MLGRVNYMRAVVRADDYVPCRTVMRAVSQVSWCSERWGGEHAANSGYIILYGRWGSAAHLCFLSNSRLICEGERSRQHGHGQGLRAALAAHI